MRAGSIVLTVESIVVLVHFAFTSGPHRAVLVTIAAASTFVASGMTVFVDRIARTGWRIEFALACALVSGIALTVSIHLGSGLDSPLVYFLVLPSISAALALPARAVVLVGAAATVEVALLAITDPATSTSFDDLFLILAFTMGVIVLTVGSALSRARLRSEEATLIDELGHLAATDPLTDCLNHGAFYERLEYEIARALRYGSPLSLVIADVDLFKAYNDAHGHAMGDTALFGVASTLKSTARTSDTVARIGGDEFALILPETPVSSANQIAARIFTFLEERDVGVTLSMGVAALDMSEPTTKRLFRDADCALYESKATGRRGVTVWQPGGAHANSELTEQTTIDTAMEDRELLEERLRHAKLETLETLSILDTLQMSAPVGLGYVDREFRFLRLNSVLAAVNGSTVEDQIGRTIAEVAPELWPQLEAKYHSVLDTAQAVSGDEVVVEIASDPGQLHYWQTSLYPVNVGGEITGIGIVAVDVTDDQKRAERSGAGRI